MTSNETSQETGKPSETGKPRPMLDAVERLWAQALLAVSSAEEEVHKVAQKVVEASGAASEDFRGRVREVSDRILTQRRELERAVEERVKKALQRVSVPRREEVAALTARMERLAERIDALAQKRSH